MANRSRGRRGRGGRAGNDDRDERALVALFQEWGLEARRVPLPAAAGEPKREPEIFKVGREPPLVGQCRTRKDGFHELYAWLEGDGADYLALRAERSEWLFVLPERVMRELLTQ